ncbi:hypothetical protein Y590_13085 [Methylobacterium sp. AMS5]|nr:hypothetical protein Y590_13085 [Methylobacterium sp. AMS5]
MLDVVLCADAAEDVREGIGILLAVGELNAVIRQDDVDAVGHRHDQITQELRRLHLASALDKMNEGELAGTVDRHEQVQLALFGADLCDIDMEVADRILLEALLLGLVAFDFRQAADAVPLQAPVQAGAGQMGDRGLQTVEAVVQRQQGMPPESDDDRLLLRCQNGRARLLRTHGRVGRRLPITPLLDRRRADAVAFSRRSHAFLT